MEHTNGCKLSISSIMVSYEILVPFSKTIGHYRQQRSYLNQMEYKDLGYGDLFH